MSSHFTLGLRGFRVAELTVALFAAMCTPMLAQAHGAGGSVTKLLASTGALVGFYGTGLGPRGIAFDGTNIWVTNNSDNTVSKIGATR